LISPAKPRKKILFVQRDLNPPGGAQAVAVWMLEALKGLYDISVLSWGPWDCHRINDHYGTSLDSGDVKCTVAPSLLRHAIDRIPNDPWKFQRLVLLQRWARMTRRRYDITITADSELDFGCRGIQYVHYPYQEDNWAKEPVHIKQMGWPRYAGRLVRTRLRPWRVISGFSFERMRHNLTLVNSQWSAGRWKDVYGTDCVTVYPPVPGTYPDVPWQERDNGFVCIGRLAGEKRYEHLIDILAVVRRSVPDIHLHIIGSAVDYDRHTYQKVKAKVLANASWVFLHEALPRTELLDLVGRHRYGLHGMVDEHFGIAVAELVRGGCIAFVPDSGGQVEIVGNRRELLYHTDEEAVGKIGHVLKHPDIQADLRTYLDSRRTLFTTETFMRRIRHIVAEHLAETNEETC